MNKKSHTPMVFATNELLSALIECDKNSGLIQGILFSGGNAVNLLNYLDLMEDKLLPRLHQAISELKSLQYDKTKEHVQQAIDTFKSKTHGEEKVFLEGDLTNRVVQSYLKKREL